MSELNPNHPVTSSMREEWHKLCALLIFKSGKTEVTIDTSDLERFLNSGLANITMRPSGDAITLRLVSDAEAARLAREEGGLPI